MIQEVVAGSPSQSPQLPTPMSGHAYPAVPTTAIGWSARESKDSTDQHTIEVPIQAYRPNTRTSSYERDKELGIVRVHEVARTPSPTPSEAQVLAPKTKFMDGVRRILDRRRNLDWRRYANPRVMATFAQVVCANMLFILFLVYQMKIIIWLQPFANWMHDTPGGWVVPIAIISVFSFPPLFGYEIVTIMCVDLWGVRIGFGLIAAGTLLGELATFYALQSFCYARGKLFEDKQLKWALYAQVVREGELVVPTIIRLSFLPGQMLTAVFSTCGMTVWCFWVSTMLSLPKQLTVVYLSAAVTTAGNPLTTGIVKIAVLIVMLTTMACATHYVNKKVDEIKGSVIYARRKARQASMLRGEEPLPMEEELALRSAAAQDLPARARSLTGGDTECVIIHMPVPQRVAVAAVRGVARPFGG